MSKNALVEWLVKVGRDRATLWKISILSRGWNIFALLVLHAFRATGRGDLYAEYATCYLIKKANGVDKLYEYVKNTNIDRLKEIVNRELGTLRDIAITLKDLVKLVDKYKLLDQRCNIDPNELYKDLSNIHRFGKKTTNFAMYDLIRIHDYPIPENLELLDEIKEKLKKLGLSEDEINKIPKEYYPYIDAALWDYKVQSPWKLVLGENIRLFILPALLTAYDRLYFDEESWSILRDAGILALEYKVKVKLTMLEQQGTSKVQLIYPYRDVVVVTA